ncbi:TniQ family protein [Azospira restricta]|uniref:TniQ family protein n=1 Tax=Azospira restricta TaxID=404405 RepID=A0A974Y4D0_9RHOO|nr:TniQ family protein [Azospira restricta]QRJ64425.1 TniQ family protein [Azospira restricta]
MGAPYTGHPGSDGVNQRWAIPVRLLPDELFSSWLVRASLVQGCDPLILTNAVWPRWRVWARDPDRGLSPTRLQALTEVSGIDEAVFEAASLLPTAQTVTGGSVAEFAIWPWVLAIGSRNRRRHGGLQCCSACLANDVVPYYRRQWRFAWHTSCRKHGVMLIDRCPECGAPLEPHRLVAEDSHLAICATCKFDLRRFASSRTDASAEAFQVAASETLAMLEGRYGEECLDPSEWFGLARWFVGLLRVAALRRSAMLATLVRALGVPPETLPVPITGLALELLPVRERADLFAAAWRLMIAGPDELLAAALAAPVTAKSVRQLRKPLPACLDEIVCNLPEGASRRRAKCQTPFTRPRSRRAVMRMWARLRRKAGMPLPC